MYIKKKTQINSVPFRIKFGEVLLLLLIQERNEIKLEVCVVKTRERERGGG